MSDNDLFPDSEFDGCMKPIEYFINDITRNLEEWAYDPGSKDIPKAIYYKTKRCFYLFSPDSKNENLIYMSCFGRTKNVRYDSFANSSSLDSIGKTFLMKDNISKRVPVL